MDPPPPPRPRAARPPPPPTESRARAAASRLRALPEHAPLSTDRARAACRASLCARIAARIPRSAAAEREASSRGRRRHRRRRRRRRRPGARRELAAQPLVQLRGVAPHTASASLDTSEAAPSARGWGRRQDHLRRQTQQLQEGQASGRRLFLDLGASSESVSRLSPRAAPGAAADAAEGPAGRAQDERSCVWPSVPRSRARTGAPRWTCPRSFVAPRGAGTEPRTHTSSIVGSAGADAAAFALAGGFPAAQIRAARATARWASRNCGWRSLLRAR